MRKEEMHSSPDMILPEIEFSSAVTQIKRGESTVISWSVKGAEEATLWKSSLLPEAPEPLDWPGISRLGEKVKFSDKLELTAEETVACYLVAKGPRGMCGSRILIHVVQEEPVPARQARMWSPPQSLLGRVEELIHVGWINQHAEFPSGSIFNDPEFVMKLAHTWDAPPPPRHRHVRQPASDL